MEKLAIQEGNTCYLQVALTKRHPDGSTSAVNLSEFDSLGFAVVRSVRKVAQELRYIITDAEGGVAVVEIPPSLPCSLYALCVSAMAGTDKLRSVELIGLQIVSDNSQVSLPDGEYEGQPSYGIDFTLQVYTGTAVRVDDGVFEGSMNPPTGGSVFQFLSMKETEISEAIGYADIAARNAQLAQKSIEQKEAEIEAAEQNRIEMENGRGVAESSRQFTELARQRQESARMGAEEQRVQQEAERNEAEQKRIEAENERRETENSRQSAEEVRQRNEQFRLENDGIRAQMESDRQSAERERSSVFYQMQRQQDVFLEKVKSDVQESLGTVTELGGRVAKLTDDVEAYIGSGLEQVVVTCVALKEGVSVERLVINVYYNGDTEHPTQYTTDASGSCSWRVTSGFQYRIVFPQIEGCATIAPITHTASIAQRSVEVEYKDIPKLVEQTVIHVTKYVNGNASAWADVPVKVTINGKTTVYNTNDVGRVELEIPVATPYSVSVDSVEGYYVYGKSSQSFVAEQTVRHLYFNYHDMGVGIFVTDGEGRDYTYDEWIASGRDGSEAIFFKFASADLINNNGVYRIKIDDIVNRVYATTRQWCNQNVLFNMIPNNGYSTTAEYFYDGLSACLAVEDEAFQRGLSIPAIAYCLNQHILLGNGQLRGFLYSVGQERIMYQNVTPLNAFLAVVRPNAAYNFTNYVNTNKWTCTQNGSSNAWYVNSGVDYNGKNNGNYGVLVAYALQL